MYLFPAGLFLPWSTKQILSQYQYIKTKTDDTFFIRDADNVTNIYVHEASIK